jgi:pimeloyl-ACP methyl ester carboxylesterase
MRRRKLGRNELEGSPARASAHERDHPGVRDAYVPVRGGRIFVRLWEQRRMSSTPPAIVLVHDSLGSVELWRDFPAALARATGHSVIAYDRLGFGRSAPHAGALKTPDFIREEAGTSLPALRSALGIDRMILFGHSVGGAMAVVAAAELAAATAGVITESAQVFAEERTLAAIRAAKQAFAEPGQLQRLARYHGTKASWVLKAWTDSWLAPAFANWTIEADLRRLVCPILAMHGDRDEFGSRAHPDRIAAWVSAPADIVLFDDCGHVPHRERTDSVLTAVRTFIHGRLAV